MVLLELRSAMKYNINNNSKTVTSMERDIMMKKFWCLALVSLALLLAACSQEDAVLPADDNNIANSEVNNVGDDANTNNNDEQSTEKIYYGQWQVEECLDAGPIYALSDGEIEQLLGTNLIYAADSFTSGSAVSEAPVYQETTESGATFTANYNNQLSLADLTISADEVVAVSITNSAYFGSNFYVKDEHTLIIVDNGVFFTAIRQ